MVAITMPDRLKPKVGKRGSFGAVHGAYVRIALRFLEFVLAVTVAGLYGVDLHHATEAGAYIDNKWLYAEIVAGLSAITCVAYGLLFCIPSEKLFFWDWVLFIMWTVLFGIFGDIYIKSDPTPEQSGQIRMKNAVWVDLVCMVLWFITASYSTLNFWRARQAARAAPPSKV